MTEELSVKQRVRQQDSVLGVGKWVGHLVISSTFVTLNSLDDSNQRRIVADDTQEDESLVVRATTAVPSADMDISTSISRMLNCLPKLISVY